MGGGDGGGDDIGLHTPGPEVRGDEATCHSLRGRHSWGGWIWDYRGLVRYGQDLERRRGSKTPFAEPG